MKFTPMYLIALLVLSACSEAPKPIANAPVVEGERVTFPADSSQLKALVTTSVEVTNEDVLHLSGRLNWDESITVRVYAPLAGRILRLVAEPGSRVAAGDVLAVLTSPEFGDVQSDAVKAGADFGVAQKAIDRARQLHEAGVIADKDLQQAEADFARATAERNRTAARTRAYGAANGSVDQQFTLRAPIAGLVVERNANPGQEVRPDQAQPGNPALFVISDPTRLWVNIEVPEAAIGNLKPGMDIQFRVAALGDEVLNAKLTHVADFIDPVTRTTRARAVVDNKERRLKAEMFVKADLAFKTGEYIRVPASAVMLLGKSQYVFVMQNANQFERRQVRAEETSFGQMRINDGIKADEKVVTEGALLLQQILVNTRKPQTK